MNPLYFDVAKFIAGEMPDPPEPEFVACNDGICLFYAGQVNLVFGDPESGKTWLALAGIAESLSQGLRGVVIDLDHNGPASTIRRLNDLGATSEQIGNPNLFRYVEPEDKLHLTQIVSDLKKWKPNIVVVDSLGEVLPLFGASSNSPDEFTRVHTEVIKPLATAGACVILIDHLAKGSESRSQGSTGTAAKKRAVGGVSIRVKVATQFTPGKGGSAYLSIAKDRHGGLRAHRPTEDKEPLAGTFHLYADGGRAWSVNAPHGNQRNPNEEPTLEDKQAIMALDPPPVTVKETRERLRIRNDRAARLLSWLKANDANVTALPERYPVTGNEGVGNTLPVTHVTLLTGPFDGC